MHLDEDVILFVSPLMCLFAAICVHKLPPVNAYISDALTIFVCVRAKPSHGAASHRMSIKCKCIM